MSSSDLLLNNILVCCLSKNTSETASKYFDTQTVSTENDVYHCLRTQLSILIMQIQEWMAVGFFRYQRCVWMYRHWSIIARHKIAKCHKNKIKQIAIHWIGLKSWLALHLLNSIIHAELDCFIWYAVSWYHRVPVFRRLISPYMGMVAWLIRHC